MLGGAATNTIRLEQTALLNPTGQALQLVNLETGDTTPIAKIGFSNASSVGSLLYDDQRHKLYATVSTCFMCWPTVLAEISVDTAALIRKLDFSINNQNPNLQSAGFDPVGNNALFWMSNVSLVRVNLETFKVDRNYTVPISNSVNDMAGNTQPAISPSGKLVAYLHMNSFNKSSYDIVVYNLHTGSLVSRVRAPVPKHNFSQALSQAPSSDPIGGSPYFFFSLSTFELNSTTVAYRVPWAAPTQIESVALPCTMSSAEYPIAVHGSYAYMATLQSSLGGCKAPCGFSMYALG